MAPFFFNVAARSTVGTTINTSNRQEACPSSQPPGDLAIWFFILAELLVFGVFFLAYAWTRRANIELFDAYQLTLDRRAGLINTLALLTSSYCVVRAVTSVREGRSRNSVRWLLAAIALGGVFLVVKLIEYQHHFSNGISLSSNSFYMFYLSLTFFHFMHVVMGMVILTAVALKAQRGGYTADNHHGVETGASYWHMVDLVWLILFSLVYVMR